MFMAGWNMPGYLPEMDPEEFEDFDDAHEFITEEMERAADDEEDDDIYSDWEEKIKHVKTHNSEFSDIAPDGYIYWVTDDQSGTRRGL